MTCWEVFTCGGVPYAGVPVTTMLNELCCGHRLDKPKNAACSIDVYVAIYYIMMVYRWFSGWLVIVNTL